MALRTALSFLTFGAVYGDRSVSSREDFCTGGSLTCGTHASQFGTTRDHGLLQRTKSTLQLHREKQSESWDKGIKLAEGLKYGKYGAQVADVYWPDAEVPAGGWLTVIAIHGLTNKAEKAFGTLCKMITKTGRQCISIDYTAMGNSFDGQVTSCSMAIDWALSPSIASTYNVDTKTGIVVYGASFGGFISGDLLWNQAYDQSRLAGVIIGNGIWKKHYEHIETATSPFVPLLALSSSDDTTVQMKFAEEAVDMLEDKGADVTHVIYTRAGHDLKTGSASLYEHISKFLSRFEAKPPPMVGSMDQWPQVCKLNCKCNDAGSVESKATTRAACQDKADDLGHRYIQYLASENTCVTSLTCDDPDTRKKIVTEEWKVYWRPQAHESGAPSNSPHPAPPSSPPAPAPSTQEPACQDNEAPMAAWGLRTCAKQQAAGKCDNDHHKGPDGYCRKTCGHCQSCQDNEAPMADWGLSTCVEQKAAGKCNKDHHKGPDGYCRKTCGYCR